MCTINAQTTSLCFVNISSLLKHSKKTFAKVFFVFILCFVKHKSVKIFDVHIMQFITINYKQQIHRVFKFLIWKVNWKNHLIFITKHVNVNIVLFFNLAKIFFSNSKSNPIIVKIISKFFIFSRNFFWMYFYRISVSNMTSKKRFLIMLISSFLNFLILQTISHKNLQIMV